MTYIFLVLFLIILSYIKSIIKQKKTIDYIIIFIMTIFYGLRYDVGLDYMTYQNIYYNTEEYYNIEILYEFLMDFFRYLNAPYWIFSVFIGLSIFLLLYKIGKQNKIEYDYLVILFVITGGLFTSFNLIRQTLAALIVFSSFKYIYNKNLVKYLIVCIIATLLHKSAIIFIPLYFICRINLDRSFSIILVIAGVALYAFNFLTIFIQEIINFLPVNYRSYLGGTFDYNVNPGLGVMFFILINLIFILYKNIILTNHPYVKPYIYMYILGYSIGLITLQSFIFSRLLEYCQLSLFVVLPKLIENIKNKNNIVLKVGIMTCYILLFVIILSDLKGENLIYKTIFNI